MILVDTSAWIRHLRRPDARLQTFLAQQRVHTCDVVVGELLLGSGLPKSFAVHLQALPRLVSPGAQETRLYLEHHRRVFAGAGVGWADAQIILAADNAGARVHTADRAIRAVCRGLSIPLA